ncbi:15419_t:CDS:1, partial [Cetraspora pellucida]
SIKRQNHLKMNPKLLLTILFYLLASTDIVNSLKACTTTITVRKTETCTVAPTPTLSCPKKNEHPKPNNDKETVICTLTETTCITPCTPDTGPCNLTCTNTSTSASDSTCCSGLCVCYAPNGTGHCQPHS